MLLEQRRRPAAGIAPFCHLEENTSMLRHAREGPARCRTREAASIFPFLGSTAEQPQRARYRGPSALLVQVDRDVRGCAFLLHDHVILRLVDD